MLEDLSSIEAIDADYRLFPQLIRDTSDFLRITNSPSTSAIIPVSSEDENDLYEQFLGESLKDTRLFDNLDNQLPDPWNLLSTLTSTLDRIFPCSLELRLCSPCTDPAHPDEGPFDIMIATLDDARAIEFEIDEDNLFAERLTIDNLAHNPLSSSDSHLPEETSWSQIPDPSYVFNDWLQLYAKNKRKPLPTTTNSATNKKLINDIQQGDFVLKLSEHPFKTHGKWTGPYLVETFSYHPSNCLIRNFITGISVKCSHFSLCHVNKCHTNHSENVLQAYAATDSEEVIIDKLIDHDLTSPQDPKYLVRWLDGTTTWEGRSVENTAAYYAYRRKYIDEPPQAKGPSTARANSKLYAAWKAQHHKSAPVVARNQHRMETRNRTSH
ncbi:hypothetical protein GEMRC1_002607 [Eukaryota sp. GEM-RC1]